MRKGIRCVVTLLTISLMFAMGCGKANALQEAETQTVESVAEESSSEKENTSETVLTESETISEMDNLSDSTEETSESEQPESTEEADKAEAKTGESAAETTVTPEPKATETPAPEVAETPTPEAPAPVTEPNPQPVVAANVVIIGDSRCVQMRDSTGGGGCVWICENSKRYEWFEQNAVPRADEVVGKGTKVVICMGVNDPGDASKYAALTNALAARWAARGAKTYYVSVNPVWENPYTTEEQVMNFNATILPQLVGVRWIDTHTYLMNTGYNLVDGLHYDSDTNIKIFNAIIGSL